MPRTIIAVYLLLLSVLAVAAQTSGETKKADDAEKLAEKAVAFLRETGGEVGRMRSIENRISFGAELASLMWFHDPKEAKAMYAATMADFKALLTQLDAEINFAQVANDDDFVSPGFFGGGRRSPAERKLYIAMAVRQQIAMSLAEHDAELAYAFFFDTANLITNAEFRKQTESSDRYFEFQLLKQVAETNAASAAKFGAASLKDEINGSHVELLKSIYAKDADKGVEFGAAILSRIKSDRKAVKVNYIFNMLLSFGGETLEASKKSGGKKAVFSASDLRDIADAFARDLLDGDPDDFSAVGFADQIDKFSPGRGAQIKAKFARYDMGSGRPGSAGGLGTGTNAVPVRIASTTGANSNAAGLGDGDVDGEREAAYMQMLKDVQAVKKELPKEEREKVVAKVRKIISATPGKEKKIGALSMLAAQVAKAGDKDLADEIMRDAERMINPYPKNYRDFLLSWMVASGYAEADAEKAFPMIDDMILRANETLAAFVKIAEFIDVNDEMISDGEVQVGMFGESMVRGVTKELGIANATLIALAKADFAKTAALTNSFDRIETRVLAKMLVLRAVLDERKVGETDISDLDSDNPDAAPPPPPAPRPK